ncbi:LapA family protein [Roseomonas marmotae]|uniref:LapA family protein n=1 Tax=Roseomonas marmotae TaxID=2768161 RepID=A0ABS3K6E3_9PROT|nr:LapA family protein [Roseomonas marmotae]MBO1073015.1 LapA family protein [Roseomonas marmotae]QTI79338.1 LapA family protein [Roseomonas marmotae]
MLALLLAAPLLLLLVLFAISNTAPVELQLWPFDFVWQLPLAGAVLGAAFLAFLLGAVLAWGSGLHYRARAHQLQNAARLLEAEVSELRAQQATQVPNTQATPVSAGTALAPAGRTA